MSDSVIFSIAKASVEKVPEDDPDTQVSVVSKSTELPSELVICILVEPSRITKLPSFVSCKSAPVVSVSFLVVSLISN